MKQRLQAALKSMKPHAYHQKTESLTSIICQEMALYEKGGNRRQNLQLVYDFC